MGSETANKKEIYASRVTLQRWGELLPKEENAGSKTLLGLPEGILIDTPTRNDFPSLRKS